MKSEIFGTQEIIILLIFLLPVATIVILSYLDSKKEKEKFSLELKEYTIVYTYASFGSRLLARLIDFIIIGIPNYLIPILPAWLYWSLQESGKSRTTVGKKALNLYVMTIEGKRISFGKATGRFVGIIITSLFTLSIGFIYMFFNNKRQCFHDIMTNTVVVKELKRINKNNIS